MGEALARNSSQVARIPKVVVVKRKPAVENWTKRKKVAAFTVAALVSYLVGWFWIVILDQPTGRIDGHGVGQIPFVTFFGAVLVGIGLVALYFGTYAVLLVVGSIWYLVLAPMRLGRWLIRVGPRAIAGYGVNIAATLAGGACLYLIGVATSQGTMSWASAILTIGLVGVLWGWEADSLLLGSTWVCPCYLMH